MREVRDKLRLDQPSSAFCEEGIARASKPLIQIQRQAEKILGIHTLTSDYEVLYSLLDVDEMSADVLHHCTRLSGTAFYNKIKDLEGAGAIASRINPEDRRSRLYFLTAEMRGLITGQQKGYRDLTSTRRAEDGSEPQSLNEFQRYIRKGEVVSHLTGDFQILLYLYLKPGISNLTISQVVDVSRTKFHASVTKLVSLGLITQHKDPADGRGKLYRLSSRAQAVLDELHAQMFRWLASRS